MFHYYYFIIIDSWIVYILIEDFSNKGKLGVRYMGTLWTMAAFFCKSKIIENSEV